jgi:hypothetical protein
MPQRATLAPDRLVQAGIIQSHDHSAARPLTNETCQSTSVRTRLSASRSFACEWMASCKWRCVSDSWMPAGAVGFPGGANPGEVQHR